MENNINIASGISIDDVEKYASSASSTNYFTLKDDGDVAVVKIMYKHAQEMQAHVVHQVDMLTPNGDTVKQYVACLQPSGMDCPFCNSGMYKNIKLFIHLLVETENGDWEYQIWERGKTMIATFQGIFSRYGKGEHGLWPNVFEIERYGKAGDKETTYQIFNVDNDGKTEEDFDSEEFEKYEVDGDIVIIMQPDQMENYLDGDNRFPDEDYSEYEENIEPTGRRPTTGGNGRQTSGASRRRTSGGRRTTGRGEDAF